MKTSSMQIMKKLDVIETRMKRLESEVKGLVDAEYPPENRFRKNFVESTKRAERRIKNGKGIHYNSFKEFRADVS